MIWYKRENAADAKQSDIILYRHAPDAALKNILTKVHGVKVVVDKKRKIYFVENVKFHFDTVKDLGEFMEVEAIDETGTIGRGKLREQCDYYAAFFGITSEEFLQYSYSDMFL